MVAQKNINPVETLKKKKKSNKLSNLFYNDCETRLQPHLLRGSRLTLWVHSSVAAVTRAINVQWGKLSVRSQQRHPASCQLLVCESPFVALTRAQCSERFQNAFTNTPLLSSIRCNICTLCTLGCLCFKRTLVCISVFKAQFGLLYSG